MPDNSLNLLTFLIIGFVIIKVFLKPYLEIKAIVNQDPQNMKNVFIPFVGYIQMMKRSLETTGHTMGENKKYLLENPNLKAIVSNFFSSPLILICDPLNAKAFYQNQQNYTKFQVGITSNDVRLYIQKWIIILNGKENMRIRKIMGKQFNYDNINNLKSLIVGITKKNIQNLKQEIGKEQKTIKLVTFLSKITGQIVSESFFGADVSQIKFKGIELHEEAVHIVEASMTLKRSPLLLTKELLLGQNLSNKYRMPIEKQYIKRENQFLHRLEQIIQDRKELRKTIKNQQKDMLDHFLDAQEDPQENHDGFVSMEIIRANFQALVIAGTDTTSHLAAYVIYNLSEHPDIYSKLVKEIGNILEEISEDNIDDLLENNYLNSVIKETLRITSPAAELFPRVANKQHNLHDLVVKKGQMVNVSIYAMNHHPKVFENPNEFVPERWQKDNPDLTPFQYTPFSAGSRNCIGQHLAMIETKVMIAYFIKNFQFERTDKPFKMALNFVVSPTSEELVKIKAK